MKDQLPLQVIDKLLALANSEQAEKSRRFFKTKPGEYGYGDKFLGIRVPVLRALVKQIKLDSIDDSFTLLANEYHEIRLFALFMLNRQFKQATEQTKATIVERYIKSNQFINNWDLVDSSAYHILGPYLDGKEDFELLRELAIDPCIWRRRMAIVATYHFIKQSILTPTYTIAPLMFPAKEDLIHKAVGWMLKEAGKRDEPRLIEFLSGHRKEMPKVMLRFAKEKLSEEVKKSI